MESMSNCPYIIPKVREGLRMGHGSVIDLMIHDGLWCPFENWHMGNAGETVADVYKVSRESAGSILRRQSQEGGRGGGRWQIHRRDPARLNSPEEGRPDGVQPR
jgi:acetyl-CoA acetyltransferase